MTRARTFATERRPTDVTLAGITSTLCTKWSAIVIMIVRVRSVESRAIPISHHLELRELRLHVVRRAADFSSELATCAAAKATGLSRRMNRIVERFTLSPHRALHQPHQLLIRL